MRKYLKIALPIAASGVIGFAPNTRALGSGELMGYIFPGVPVSDANEIAWVQALVISHNGGPTDYPPVVAGNDLLRTNYDPSDITFPDAVFSSRNTSPASGNEIEGAGSLYLLARYEDATGGASVVYFLDGIGMDLPDTFLNQPLKHITFFNTELEEEPGDREPPTGLPDGGATAMLLGAGLLGLATVSRKH